MLNRGTQSDEDWYKAFVHESGHVVMAIQHGIRCDGIYYMKKHQKLCNVSYLPPVPHVCLAEHFQFHSAGSAAELLIYRFWDDAAAKSDKVPFRNEGAPDYEATVNQSLAILRTKRFQLDRLISIVNSKYQRVHFDALPETTIQGIDGKLGVLLSKQELEDEVKAFRSELCRAIVTGTN